MRHKFLTKLVLGVLISTILVGGVTTLSYAQSGQVEIGEQNTRQSFDQIKNRVERYLVLNKDGTIGISENMPSFYSEEYQIDGLLEHFEVLNQDVLNGKITINSDFSITENLAREERYRQTFERRHWWGYENWYAYNDAVEVIALYNKAGNTSFVLGTALLFVAKGMANLGLVIGAGLANFAGGFYDLSALVLKGLASDMDFRNERNGKRGIVTEINWAFYCNVYSQ